MGSEIATADSTTLAKVLRDFGIERVKLLKIDCEGAEYEIIGDGSILDNVEYLSGEFHSSSSFNGNTPESLAALCKQKLGNDKVFVTPQRLA